MAICIECENFDVPECTKLGFYAKCPEIHLECRGFKHTKKNNCLKDYDDFCEHREISEVPFSADWCKKKHTYCNNNKINLGKKT